MKLRYSFTYIPGIASLYKFYINCYVSGYNCYKSYTNSYKHVAVPLNSSKYHQTSGFWCLAASKTAGLMVFWCLRTPNDVVLMVWDLKMTSNHLFLMFGPSKRHQIDFLCRLGMGWAPPTGTASLLFFTHHLRTTGGLTPTSRLF